MCSHIGTHEDIKVQIIGHCDPNDQEAKEDFWIFHLDTLHPKGLTLKRLGGAGEMVNPSPWFFEKCIF